MRLQPFTMSPDYHENYRNFKGGEDGYTACAICGKGISVESLRAQLRILEVLAKIGADSK